MGSKILLADDSITIQKVVNLTFADEGIDVVTVSNGEMAERRLSEISPDLVLADIFMPGRNGYELCQFVKESPQFRNVPVVLLVGAFEPFDQAEARRVKADAHLTKPFESRTLVETVRKLIEASRAKSGSLRPVPPPPPPPPPVKETRRLDLIDTPPEEFQGGFQGGYQTNLQLDLPGPGEAPRPHASVQDEQTVHQPAFELAGDVPAASVEPAAEPFSVDYSSLWKGTDQSTGVATPATGELPAIAIEIGDFTPAPSPGPSTPQMGFAVAPPDETPAVEFSTASIEQPQVTAPVVTGEAASSGGFDFAIVQPSANTQPTTADELSLQLPEPDAPPHSFALPEPVAPPPQSFALPEPVAPPPHSFALPEPVAPPQSFALPEPVAPPQSFALPEPVAPPPSFELPEPVAPPPSFALPEPVAPPHAFTPFSGGSQYSGGETSTGFSVPSAFSPATNDIVVDFNQVENAEAPLASEPVAFDVIPPPPAPGTWPVEAKNELVEAGAQEPLPSFDSPAVPQPFVPQPFDTSELLPEASDEAYTTPSAERPAAFDNTSVGFTFSPVEQVREAPIADSAIPYSSTTEEAIPSQAALQGVLVDEEPLGDVFSDEGEEGAVPPRVVGFSDELTQAGALGIDLPPTTQPQYAGWQASSAMGGKTSPQTVRTTGELLNGSRVDQGSAGEAEVLGGEAFSFPEPDKPQLAFEAVSIEATPLDEAAPAIVESKPGTNGQAAVSTPEQFTTSGIWADEALFSSIEVEPPPPVTPDVVTDVAAAVVTDAVAPVVTDVVAERYDIAPAYDEPIEVLAPPPRFSPPPAPAVSEAAEREASFKLPEPAPGEIGFDIVQDQGARKADTATASIASSAVDLPVAAIDEIVRRVVNEITDSVIREIAWEVVPDCVERIVEKLSREAMAKRA